MIGFSSFGSGQLQAWEKRRKRQGAAKARALRALERRLP